MNYKHVIYALFTFILSFSVGAAEFSRYLINHSVEEGLSQSLVNQTLQDSDGYIWVATEFGLNRFDGYEFEQILGPNNSFASDGIVHLALLESGELFVSTYYNGAYLLNTKTLAANQIFSGRLAEVSDDVLSVDFVLEKNNALWFAIGQHLVEYNRQAKSYVVRYSMGNDEQAIRALTLDNDSLYMATTRGLRLYEVTSKRVVSLEHLPASVEKTRDNINVKAFLHDASLGLLIGTVQGLYSFDLITKKPKAVIVPELNIWGIIDKGAELFIGTQRGLYTYDKNAKKINHLVKYSDVNPLITNNSIKN
ncbi:MAG: ligand-binding sensor domain-containing protein, partial [Psychrobium sp.]